RDFLRQARLLLGGVGACGGCERFAQQSAQKPTAWRRPPRSSWSGMVPRDRRGGGRGGGASGRAPRDGGGGARTPPRGSRARRRAGVGPGEREPRGLASATARLGGGLGEEIAAAHMGIERKGPSRSRPCRWTPRFRSPTRHAGPA